VIDYACGAGHFLNEYASQNQNSEIVGIEKEYRLSKVAKVSSFMYGSEIDIIYSDALSQNEKIKNNSFDVLIANPPYSVKGFLETLNDEERNAYELIKTIDEKSYQTNNAIECFFIERAKQLLDKNGVAGIIVPSSILNKGNKNSIYVKTREIILRFFDIAAIAEFGSGTFGKTGTNTVTLFLQRKCDKENLEGNLADLTNKLFERKFDIHDSFKDKDLLLKYCNHIKIDLEVYKSLICENLNDEIFAYETFKEYKQEFEKLSETKNRRSKPNYKNLSDDEKQNLEQKELIKFIKAIEKDKFYYFCLADKNSFDVVIVKSPSNNKEAKKFLGYEWSSAKGNEGIQYLSSSVVAVDNESLDEEDKRILENLTGLKSINTPLYNPQNSDDTSKINKIIKDNFENKKAKIPNELSGYVSRAKLIDMLDFSRVEFNKAIGLNPNKKVEIIGKAEWQRKLGDVVEVLIGGTPSRANSEYFKGQNLWVSISEMNGQIINDTKEKISDEAIKKSNVKLIPKGTTLLSFKLSIGKTAIAGKDLYTNEAIAGLIPKTKELRDDYLFHLFNGKIIDLEKDGFNTFGKSLNSAFLKNEVKIPLPPLEIQEEIVKECQKVDDEVAKANETIEQAKKEIEKEINSVGGEMVKLGDIVIKVSDFIDPQTKNGKVNYIGLENIESNTGNLIGNIETEYIDIKSNKTVFKKGDILYGKLRPNLNKVCLATFDGVCSTDILVFRFNNEYLSKFYLHYFLTKKFNDEVLKGVNGVQLPRTSFTNISQIKIPLPPLETQKQIVSKIETLENQINEVKKVIESAKEKKEEILKRHL
ncbi:MAG: restriction endonuclease subunit S, partial [Campylobacterales bacterium]|nr:restriction endonuclease subunit S [Campylobacterales bacterium]